MINEFLALNTGGITDQDGQRWDWIELKNTESASVNIGGWHLADSVDKWQFPSVTLTPNEHLLVFASGKNRAVAGQELHTNFQLDADGESLKLLDAGRHHGGRRVRSVSGSVGEYFLRPYCGYLVDRPAD